VTLRFVSFAQNLEDVMLWRALRGVERGFYVDVGAGSPEVDSVTKAFYDRGWQGVNVEPHPELFQQLGSARPRDTNLRVALADRVAERTIYFASHAALSTLDQGQARQLAGEGMAIAQERVHVETLASMWREHVPVGQAVHFLKIDVEGFERHVLLGNDWQSNRPWIVVVEATRPQTLEPSHDEWEQILTDVGYEFVYADGLNRFYVAGEHASLSQAFRYPPNVFDEYVSASEVEAREKAIRAETALAALQASRSWRLTAPLRAASAMSRRLKAAMSRAIGRLSGR